MQARTGQFRPLAQLGHSFSRPFIASRQPHHPLCFSDLVDLSQRRCAPPGLHQLGEEVGVAPPLSTQYVISLFVFDMAFGELLPGALARCGTQEALSLASEMRKNLWCASCVWRPPHPMGFTILPLTGTSNEGLEPHKARYHGSGGWEGTDEAVNVQPCSLAGRDVQP
jgi:hypothetical protein